MKATFLRLGAMSLLFVFMLGLVVTPLQLSAQDASADTTQAVQDNSSSFNDSVQCDDMEPIFYEAAEDDEAESDSGSSGIFLYVGIAVVLLVVLIVLKKAGKKKSA